MADCVRVKAIAKGYHIGPRAPGDEFDMPFNKDGTKPKGSWFTIVEPPKSTPAKGKATVLSDADLV